MWQPSPLPRRSLGLLLKSCDPSFVKLLEGIASNTDKEIGAIVTRFRPIDQDRVEALVPTIRDNKVEVIESLVLNHCSLSGLHSGILAEPLLAAPISLHIRVLNLSFNRIGNSGAEVFGRVLSENHTLEVLVLKNNDIDGSGAMDLAEGLAENDSLQQLYLNGNPIGPTGATSMGLALEHNISLQFLDLSRTEIDGVGFIHFAGSLMFANNTLKVLDLNSNDIGKLGAVAVGALLLKNAGLACIYLCDNEIPDDGATFIIAALTRNSTLMTLYLDCNIIGLEAAMHFKELVATGANETLRVISLHPGWENMEDVQQEIDQYCARNGAGYWLAFDEMIPTTLWPRILAKGRMNPSLLYDFLREKPELLKRAYCSLLPPPTNDASGGASKKRPHDEISAA